MPSKWQSTPLANNPSPTLPLLGKGVMYWQILRKRQIHGMKFLRQFRIEHSNINGIKNCFIVDFYCHELKLIIEVEEKFTTIILIMIRKDRRF